MSFKVENTSYHNKSSKHPAAEFALPPKYKDGRINPEWIEWNAVQNLKHGSHAPGTTIPHPDTALPMICNLDDKLAFEKSLKQDIILPPQVEKTLEEFKLPSYASHVGLESQEMVDELGKLMARYEIPLGLITKFSAFSSYHRIEFIIDDSRSMQGSSGKDENGRPITRKDEALARVLEMVEVLCYINSPTIKFRFLNYNNKKICLELKRKGERPVDYFERAKSEIHKLWRNSSWDGSTPMRETMEKSFKDGKGERVVRYIFGDGAPNGGSSDVEKMTHMMKERNGPKDNPFSFMSCTDRDEDTEWMKTLEESAPYCSESDDYKTEAREVEGDQGEALPYTKGFYLMCELVAAMNPDDLDCMDESVPFSKQDFDLLQGYISSDDGYKCYFDAFRNAQKKRAMAYKQSAEDKVKNTMQWKKLYKDLCKVEHASDLKEVQDYKYQLRHAK